MVIKALDCRMYVGQQRRTRVFTVHVDPDDIEACRALAKHLAAMHRLPAALAVMHLKVGPRWVQHRAS